MVNNIQQSCWPISRVGEALEALARKSAFLVKPVDVTKNASGSDEGIEALASGLGFELEPVEMSYSDLGHQLQSLAPALIRLPGDGLPSFVALLRGGWQLSHGERSRLYIARALLQGSDLIVLDESFASLDPETLQQCFQCVLDRAPALLVIAHP